jgi:hypothetical protein
MGGGKKPDSTLGLDPLPPQFESWEKILFYIQVNMANMKWPLYWLSQPIALKYYCPKERYLVALGLMMGTILLKWERLMFLNYIPFVQIII